MPLFPGTSFYPSFRPRWNNPQIRPLNGQFKAMAIMVLRVTTITTSKIRATKSFKEMDKMAQMESTRITTRFRSTRRQCTQRCRLWLRWKRQRKWKRSQKQKRRNISGNFDSSLRNNNFPGDRWMRLCCFQKNSVAKFTRDTLRRTIDQFQSF